MRVLVGIGAIAVALAACTAPAGEDAEPLGDTHSAIVGGSPSPASQDATVLINDRGDPVCSGTLIAPNLVLTARHCVAEIDESSECGTVWNDLPASRLTVSVGPDASPRDYVARGVKLSVPASDELCSADVALLSLDNDVKNVTPAKVSFTSLGKDDSGTAIGYGGGDTRTERSGVKILAVGPSKYSYRTQSGDLIVMDPLANEIVTTESTCFGDSGGPLLDSQGRVFAVASRGIDDVCRDRPTFWTTLGGHEELIRDAASAAGHPIVDAAPASPTPGGPSPTVAGGDPAAGDDDDDAKSGGTKKKKPSAKSDGLGSAGCAQAPGPRTSDPAAALVGVALAFAALRRRERAPSSRLSRR